MRNLRRFMFTGLLLMFVVAVSGCGGGGGESTPSTGSGNTSSTVPTIQVAAAMTTFSPVSDAEYEAAVAAVAALLKANYDASVLGGWTRQQKAANGLAAIQSASATIPGFYDAGLGPDKNTVWVRLKNGEGIGQIDDEAAWLTQTTTASLASPFSLGWAATGVIRLTLATAGRWLDDVLVQPAQAQTAKVQLALPGARNALVIDTDSATPTVDAELPKMLTKRGYVVVSGATITAPTLAMYRSQFDGTVGVVFISTHLVQYTKDDGTAGIAMQATATRNSPKCQDSPAECDLNKADVKAHLIKAGCDEKTGSCAEAITGEWMQTRWKFPDGALVYLNSCSSSIFFPFVAADTVLGWSKTVYAIFSDLTGMWFFDRVLGANQHLPNSPKQRPFSASAVHEYMKSNGLTVDTNLSNTELLLRTGAYETILAPSLRNMQVDEVKQELTLYGEFGIAPGYVDIGGSVKLPTWTDRKVTVPLSTPDGGSVTVTVNGISGNAVPLTYWTLSTYNAREYKVGSLGVSAPGPFTGVSCDRLQFRSDIHSYRLAPEETPHPGDMSDTTPGRDTGRVHIHNVINSSTCVSDTGGSGITPDGKTKYSLTLTATFLPWAANSAKSLGPPGFFATVRMFPEQKTFTVCVNSLVMAPTKLTVLTLSSGDSYESEWVSSTSGVCAASLAKTWPLGADFSTNVAKEQFSLGIYGPGDFGEVTISGSTQTNPDPATIPTADTEG